MKYAILGSGGALGGALSKLYSQSSGENHAVRSFRREELDITDPASLDQMIDFKPDAVFNCAAYNNVDAAENESAQIDEINGYAVGKLAGVCKLIRATLVHFSTDYVFDGTNQNGNTETGQPNPLNAYGQSKLLGETEVARVKGNYYIIRTAWLYGGKPTGASAKKSFVEHIVEQAKSGQEIKVVSDQFGTPTYIPDLAIASQQLLNVHSPFGIYHLINSGRASRYQWAQEILNLTGLKTQLTPISYRDLPQKADRPQYSFLLNTKRPALRPWPEALKEYLSKTYALAKNSLNKR